jgi:hypothetical protein
MDTRRDIENLIFAYAEYIDSGDFGSAVYRHLRA